jgi:hypothetical protein
VTVFTFTCTPTPAPLPARSRRPRPLPRPAPPARRRRPPVATTQPQGGAFGRLCVDIAAAFANPESRVQAITAALSDLTYSSQSGNIMQPEWSGELWSGLEFAAEFSDVFNTGGMTASVRNRLAVRDQAGHGRLRRRQGRDPLARGHHRNVGLDRRPSGRRPRRRPRFLRLPDPDFIESLFQQARESWAINMDGKKKAYIVAQAKAALSNEANLASAAIPAQDTLLKRGRDGRPMPSSAAASAPPIGCT